MYARLVRRARVVVPDVAATMRVLVHHVVALRISLIVRDADDVVVIVFFDQNPVHPVVRCSRLRDLIAVAGFVTSAV